MADNLILVVDDNEVNRLVASEMLVHFGHQAITAEDGKQAVQIWSRTAPKLILMDCQMPLLDGYSATRQIRSREAQGQRTPIIALTANSQVTDRQACLAAGMDDYLSKPISADALQRVLSKWLTAAATSQYQNPMRANTMTVDNILDENTLNSLRGFLSPDKLTLLLQRYVEDGSKLIRQLGEACASGDAEVARRSAHSLKSTSANVGALRLSAVARELEDCGKAGDLVTIRTRMAEVQDLFTSVRSAIETMGGAAKRSA